MRVSELWSYESPLYAGIREPARGVVEAYQNAWRWLDTVKEWLYIDAGLIHVSAFVHGTAHRQGELLDRFADILHERHLAVEYPATEELREEIDGVSRAFEICAGCLDGIGEALEAFYLVTDKGILRPMALGAEELMQENSRLYTELSQLWEMWDKGVSASSFDSWVGRLVKDGQV